MKTTKYDTKKVVDHVVDSYRKAGKAMAKAERRNDDLSSWMNQDVFDQDADAILDAYNAGKFDNVDASQLDSLMDKFGAADIYHLMASYFNATGKILNVTE